MNDEEARQLAEGIFRRHCEGCPQCGRFDGQLANLGQLCQRGGELYRNTKDPQRFEGQRRRHR